MTKTTYELSIINKDRTSNAIRLQEASGYNGAAPLKRIQNYQQQEAKLLEEYVTSDMEDEEYQSRRLTIEQP